MADQYMKNPVRVFVGSLDLNASTSTASVCMLWFKFLLFIFFIIKQGPLVEFCSSKKALIIQFNTKGNNTSDSKLKTKNFVATFLICNSKSH